MTNPTPLNPDALEAAGEAIATRNGFGFPLFSHKGDANAAVWAYLNSLPVAPLQLTNAEWQAFQAIPDQGYSHRAWVDARIAERVALAVAQPVVNSVEELDQLPVGSVVLDPFGASATKVNLSVSRPWLGESIQWFRVTSALETGYQYRAPHLPARVLYRPEVNDA